MRSRGTYCDEIRTEIEKFKNINDMFKAVTQQEEERTNGGKKCWGCQSKLDVFSVEQFLMICMIIAKRITITSKAILQTCYHFAAFNSHAFGVMIGRSVESSDN